MDHIAIACCFYWLDAYRLVLFSAAKWASAGAYGLIECTEAGTQWAISMLAQMASDRQGMALKPYELPAQYERIAELECDCGPLVFY